MEILNINSEDFDDTKQTLAGLPLKELTKGVNIKNQGFWQNLIFLVDKDLMDKIVPRELTSCLNEDKLKEIIEKHKNNRKVYSKKNENDDGDDAYEEDDEDFWKDIKESESPFKPDSYASGGLFFQVFWGVYIPSFSSDETHKKIDSILDKKIDSIYITNTEKEFYKKVKNKIDETFNSNDPVIFLCPERINYFSNPKISDIKDTTQERNFQTLFVYISIKCIAYHYMHGHVTSSWSKYINHSLTSFIARKQFEERKGEKRNNDLYILDSLLNNSVLEDRFVLLWENMNTGRRLEFNIWLVKWGLDQPAISDTHYSEIMIELYKTAGKVFSPSLKKNDGCNFLFKKNEFDVFLDKYGTILGTSKSFWSKIARRIFEAWLRNPKKFYKK